LSIYADSSFFVSHYLQDAHHGEASRRIATHPLLWLTPFHQSEIAHAVFLHVFYKKISVNEANLVLGYFHQDCDAGIWVQMELPETTWETSIDLARRFGPTLRVRTLDSLHVACALELKAQRFWTFDQRQAKLAEAVGLDTAS
jgi:predicted nucleic acid-binding protein